jgi:hypothetical protein
MINDSCENEKTNKKLNELEANNNESMKVAKKLSKTTAAKLLTKSLSSTHPVSMIATAEQNNNSLKNEDLSSFSILNNEEKNCLRRRNKVKKTIEFSSPLSNELLEANSDQTKLVSSKTKIKPCFSLNELQSLISANNNLSKKDSDLEDLGSSIDANKQSNDSNMIKIMNVLNDDANELDFYDEQTCSSSYSSPSLIRSNSNNQNDSCLTNKEINKKDGQFYINYDCNYDYEDDFDDDDDDENELTEESDQTELCCFNDQNNNNDFTFNKKSDVVTKRKQSNQNQIDIDVRLSNNEECQTTVETSSKSTPSQTIFVQKNHKNNKVNLFFVKFLGKNMIYILILG